MLLLKNVKVHHNLRQWLFFSKGSKLSTSDTYGVDGWILNVYTEKNKLAPSQYSVDVVFDKKYGIDKLWSEYHFLSEMTKTEKKLFKNDANKLPYPLSVKTSAKSRFLEVVNPETGEIYTSDKFSERKFKEKYYKEKAFQKLFNYAIETATKERIINYLFKYEESVKEDIKEKEEQDQEGNSDQSNEVKQEE